LSILKVKISRVLIIVAHPDDEVLGCGATIAKHINNGDKVQVVFLTDGFSSRDNDSNRDCSAEKASKVLGCMKPVFLNLPDNQLDTISLLEIVKKVEKSIECFQPNIVYTHHFGDLNIDHQITHRAVITACRPQPNFCVKEIYSFEILSATHWQSMSMENAFNPNYFIDVNEFMDSKMRALQCYDSEMRDYPHARSYKAVESLAKYRGVLAGLMAAEAFVVLRNIS
jgi:N-acetylglucosamine malate deacetylase 1